VPRIEEIPGQIEEALDPREQSAADGMAIAVMRKAAYDRAAPNVWMRENDLASLARANLEAAVVGM